MATETEEDLITVTISGVSAELLQKIDRLAEKEDRSRSNFLRLKLEEIVAQKPKP
jgi:predicted transcriptional regulator